MFDSGLRFHEGTHEVHHLADGTELRLRLLRPSDRAAFLAAFEKMSPESRYRRFFSAMPRMPQNVLEDLLAVDNVDHLAIVAFTASDGNGVGIGRFIRLKDKPDTAEAAVAVIDSMQGRGIGKLLLATLMDAAVERGVHKFQAQVLTDNEAMKALLHDLDRSAVPTIDGPVATYTLELPERTPEGFLPGPLFDLLRAAGRGLEVLLENLRHFPGY